jgi:ArsR family transcriptional regulator, arsenate/arsenite/antimonite-responsive transcriptional repressor
VRSPTEQLVHQKRTLGVIDDSVVSRCSPLGDDPLSEREAHEMALVYSALSDPVRLRLLSFVASADEVCSCNLEALLGKSQPTVSHHTRVLSEAGLIVGERRGRWVWWRVVPERLGAVANFLQP